jgi:predicted nucleic acid-binding protein
MVVDASAIAPLVFPDEDHGYSEAVVRALADTGGVVPALFWYEIGNILCVNVCRRKRIDRQQAVAFIGVVRQLGTAQK